MKTKRQRDVLQISPSQNGSRTNQQLKAMTVMLSKSQNHLSIILYGAANREMFDS